MVRLLAFNSISSTERASNSTMLYEEVLIFTVSISVQNSLGTARRESLPKIAEWDVEMTT